MVLGYRVHGRGIPADADLLGTSEIKSDFRIVSGQMQTNNRIEPSASLRLHFTLKYLERKMVMGCIVRPGKVVLERELEAFGLGRCVD